MLENLIPSRTVREYIEKTGRKFTDFEKAAIIYNMKFSFEKTKEEMQKLTECTEDDALRKQIEEYIKRETYYRQSFWENAEGRFVYAVDLDNPEWDIEGNFETGKKAYAYGKELGHDFFILKYEVTEDGEVYQSPVVSYYFDKEGKEVFFWSEWEAPNELQLDCSDPARFENTFVDIPNPFEIGDIVRLVDTDLHGIISVSKEECKRINDEIKSREEYVGSKYTSTRVDFIFDRGHISNNNAFIGFLEKYEPSDDDANKELLLSGSDLYKGHGNLAQFSRCYNAWK